MTGFWRTSILQAHLDWAKGGKTIDPTIRNFIIGFTVVSVLAVGVMAFLILQSQGQLEFTGDPDLTVSVTASPDPARAGEALSYTFTVRNQGEGDATGVSLNDPLPDGVEFESATPGAPACKESGEIVACNLGTMAVGALATVKINVIVDASAEGTITNTGRVLAREVEEPRNNNSATVSIAIE